VEWVKEIVRRGGRGMGARGEYRFERFMKPKRGGGFPMSFTSPDFVFENFLFIKCL